MSESSRQERPTMADKGTEWSSRAGFILCNDLEVAAGIIAREPVPVGGIAAKEKAPKEGKPAKK